MAELPERLAQPALAGLWAHAWRTLASVGERWPTVRIALPVDPGDAEVRHAVGGLLGRVLRPGARSIGVVLGELDAAVQRAGDGWGLRAVVEAAVGPLPDRRGDADARHQAVAAAVDEARRTGPGDAWFARWLALVETDGTASRLAGRAELDLLATAARVISDLPAGGEPLPALAARLTADPKALSGGTLAGLVLRALAAWQDQAPPTGAAGRRSLWEAAGVVPDDLASQVLVLNLPVVDGPGLAGWLRGAAELGEPFRITLRQLNGSGPLAMAPHRAPVHVCENPAVLRAATQRFGPGSAPLVCTEGRPSVAVERLLAMIAAGGVPLRHHGDFDWPGVRIVGALLDARPGVARPWRFGATDYERARQRSRPAPNRRLSGATPTTPWDPALAAAMEGDGGVVYEEDVLDDLLDDLAPER